MIILPSGINSEKEKDYSRPRNVVEIAAAGGTVYLSTEEFTHNGNAYEEKIVSLGEWSRALSYPEDQVRKISTADIDIADMDRSVRNAVSAGDTVTLSRIFLDVANESLAVFIGRVSSIRHKEGKTTLTIQREKEIVYRQVPSKRFTAADYPSIDSSLYGRVIPVVFGARRIPLIPLKFTKTTTADANWNLTVTYQADFCASAGNITAATLLKDGNPADPADYTVSLDGPNNPTYPGLATISFYGNALRPDGTEAVFEADVTGIVGVSTPEEYLLDLWTNTDYGLGQAQSDFDSGYLAAWSVDLATLNLQASAYLDTPLKWKTILSDVMFATRSHWGYDDAGKIVIQMDVAQSTPVYAFDENDIILGTMEEWEVDHTKIVHSASLSWKTTETTDPATARIQAANPALAAENYEKSVTWAYPTAIPMSKDDVQFSTFCLDDYAAAGDLLQYRVKLSCESRKRCRFQTSLKGLGITEIDRVDIYFPRFGWSNAPWIVEEVKSIADGRIELTCREYVSTIYSPDTSFADPGSGTPPANLFPPDPPIWDAQALTLSGHLNSDGTYVRDVTAHFSLQTGINNIGITGVQVWISYDGITYTQDSTVTQETAVISGVQQGQTLYVKLIAAKGPALISVDSVISSITVGAKTTPPSDVTSFVAALQDYGVVLSWGAISDTDVAGYEIRMGGTDWWSAQTIVSSLRATSYLYKSMPAGTQTFRIRAIDTSGNYSANDATTLLTISAPGQPSVSSQFSGESVILTWTDPTTDFTVVDYEIRHGSVSDTWATATPDGTVKATTYRTKVNWGGTRRYFIQAIDSAGNVGAAGTIDVVINAPGKPTSFLSEVIDNNVLLRWVGVLGPLPIDYFEVRKGTNFNTATVLGSLKGTFFTSYETVSGDYTYWVVGVDTAGNYGTPESLTTSVNEPPDYVLHQDWASTFSGTKTNLVIDPDTGFLVGPVDTTETWQSHFTGHSWNSPQDQITAGYSYYMEPALTTGTYVETFDYGTLLAGTQVTVTIDRTDIDGSETITCDIAVSPDGLSWTTYSNVWQVFATNFRYVKVTLHFSGTDTDLVEVKHMHVKLSVRLIGDAGAGYANSTDSGGTTVYFNKAFVDVTSIIVTPKATVARIAIYDFVDVPNPTTFSVYLFDTNGTRVSGDFSWNAKGY